jgi:hypothetical protein
VGIAVVLGVAALGVGVAITSGADPTLTNVPSVNVKAAGFAPAHVLSPELLEAPVAQGSMRLENPEGIIGWYGYENDAPSPDDPSLPQLVPASLASPVEAQKTEPDKNTYLVLENQTGPDAAYDYGTHFLFQGHEGAAKNGGGQKLGYITRVNLDADSKHRVTLMASTDTDGDPLATIDGSTWDPFAQRLLFTTESASSPTYAATATYPSQVTDVSGALGRGGYEGIQDDGDGNIWIVEDIGGAKKQGTTAKRPNSYVYRYVLAKPGDLQHGRLQALQVLNSAHAPITFASESALMAPDQVVLHTYGKVFDTRWVTVHDTATDGNASFNANTLAQAAGATPFKRPENAAFRPESKFREFYFDETGDTDATSPENGDPATGAGGAGGWGSIMKLTQSDPSAGTGTLTIFYRANESVSGLDNTTFLSKNEIAFVEDAGDTLHTQRQALDSAYVWNVLLSYAGAAKPVRWLAEGRDASATLDSANGGFGKNDGDNEITGLLVSNGDASQNGILGTHAPDVKKNDYGPSPWRWFWTQQHGDNVTWEVKIAGK